MLKSRKDREVAAGDALFACKVYGILFMVAALHYVVYGGNTAMMVKHAIFICIHLFLVGVKTHTYGNFNGFDLVFGCFYLYFWWQEPIAFMLSYFVWGLIAYWVFRMVPHRDETSAYVAATLGWSPFSLSLGGLHKLAHFP